MSKRLKQEDSVSGKKMLNNQLFICFSFLDENIDSILYLSIKPESRGNRYLGFVQR